MRTPNDTVEAWPMFRMNWRWWGETARSSVDAQIHGILFRQQRLQRKPRVFGVRDHA